MIKRTLIGLLLIIIFVPNAFAGIRFVSPETEVSAALDQAEVHCEFKFTNDGKRPLVIGRITTSCGCTVAQADRKIYLPGENGEISVTVKVGASQGRLDKTIAIETNDGETPSVTLKVHVLIPQLVAFAPNEYLRWDEGGDPNPQTVTVAVEAPFPLKIVGLKSWHDKMKATLKEVEPGKKYEITVTPDDTKDEMNSAIELLTEAKWPGEPKKIWLLIHIKPKGHI